MPAHAEATFDAPSMSVMTMARLAGPPSDPPAPSVASVYCDRSSAFVGAVAVLNDDTPWTTNSTRTRSAADAELSVYPTVPAPITRTTPLFVKFVVSPYNTKYTSDDWPVAFCPPRVNRSYSVRRP